MPPPGVHAGHDYRRVHRRRDAGRPTRRSAPTADDLSRIPEPSSSSGRKARTEASPGHNRTPPVSSSAAFGTGNRRPWRSPAGANVDAERPSDGTNPDADGTAGSVSNSRSVTLGGGKQRTVTVNVWAASLGNRTLRVGSYTQSVAVYRHSPFSVPTLPSRAPPNETMAIPVRTINGDTVSNATVRVGNRTAETDESGIAPVLLPGREGTYNLTVEKGNRVNRSPVHVVSDATRSPIGTVDVSPRDLNAVSHPTARIVLFNPWNRQITQPISFVTPAKTVTRAVSIPPHESVVTTRELGGAGAETSATAGTSDSNGMLSPGDYSVRVVADSRTIAMDSFTVHGDSRTFRRSPETPTTAAGPESGAPSAACSAISTSSCW